jgi:hypothetical protein
LAAGAAAAGVPTAACSSADPAGQTSGGSGRTARAARAETALRARSAGTSRELLGQYDAVLARHPAQHTRLAPLRAAVAQHVTALSPKARQPGRVRKPAEPAASASVTAAAPASATVPADPAAALRVLAAAERRTADAHTRSLMDASPELARLLASLAAAGAAHAYLLTEGPRS